MFEEGVQLLVAPALVATATLAARRWGHRVGGLISAFPAIVGPVLLIGAERHGSAFAAQAATGTLIGLVSLSAFALACGRTAPHVSWPVSLMAGWAFAAAAAALASTVEASLTGALAIAVASLALAYRGLAPGVFQASWLDPPRGDLAVRMALTFLLVASLAAAGGWLGPTASGVLAALPVLACVLAAFTHARSGGAASSQLLRGMLSGMPGFVIFCALVAGLIEHAGVGVTFVAATAAALSLQGAVAWTLTRPKRERSAELMPDMT